MLNLFLKHIKLILTWGVLVAVAVLVVTLFLPKYYSATSQVLIISRGSAGVDPYTQAKSAERVGENLAQVVGTTDFYQKVMDSSFGFNKERWTKLSERDARKQWKQDVGATMVYNTGLMNLTVYSTSQADALAFSGAVTEAMVSRGWEYVGGDVALKAVNSPLVSRLPARPNYILDIALGFLAGIAFASYWVWRAGRHTLFGRGI
ncbi:MAG: hypothetical protein WCT40_04780 [Candidatus Magasanikbacteria bacterium]|jgi:capsular polysaccharide biosynthesis protein